MKRSSYSETPYGKMHDRMTKASEKAKPRFIYDKNGDVVVLSAIQPHLYTGLYKTVLAGF